jgi:hypothetical protein
VSERLRRAHKGVRGGVQGGGAPRAGVQGQRRRFFFLFRVDIFSPGRADTFSPGDIFPGRHISRTTYYRDDIFLGPHDIRWFFSTWLFAYGFLFSVKELGFWTNPGHWVRVLDAAGSYMYIVL